MFLARNPWYLQIPSELSITSISSSNYFYSSEYYANHSSDLTNSDCFQILYFNDLLILSILHCKIAILSSLSRINTYYLWIVFIVSLPFDFADLLNLSALSLYPRVPLFFHNPCALPFLCYIKYLIYDLDQVI